MDQNSIRVLYVINSFSAGGAERYLLNLSDYMIGSQNTVCVVSLSRSSVDNAVNLKHDFIRIGCKAYTLSEYGGNIFLKWAHLIKIVKNFKPDIIHSHLPRADLLVGHVKLFFPKIIWVSTVHDAYDKDKFNGYWVFPFVKYIWKLSSGFIAVSDHVKLWIEKKYGVSSDNVQVIFHGVNVFNKAKEKKIHDSKIILGCLSRYEPRKGIITLIKMMPRIINNNPSVMLLIAGSDPDKYSIYLQDKINSMSLQNNIKLVGFQEDPYNFLEDVDIFTHASKSEGFGLVIIEAMSMKKPVVASNIDPINYIVQDNHTGFLADPCSYEDFSSKVIRLINDKQLRYKFGENGFNRVKVFFSLNASLEKVKEKYFYLLDKNE
jgi:glycosyltransferase involved in cell wall biosynthesis